MKKVIFILLACILAFGFTCARNVPNPVCPAPEGKESWICEKSIEADIMPETVYGWIFNANAILILADRVEFQEVCDFKKEISDWYLKMYPVSYDSVINEAIARTKLFKDPKKVILMKSMLNENLSMYASPELIYDYDDWIMRAGSRKFDQQMMCE